MKNVLKQLQKNVKLYIVDGGTSHNSVQTLLEICVPENFQNGFVDTFAISQVSAVVAGCCGRNQSWLFGCLTLRLLMSYIYIYIYGAPILDVSKSHTTTQHSR